MKNRHWRIAAAGLFAALAVSACSKSAEDHARDFDREADNNPVLTTLRDTDPVFYQQIRDRAASRLAAGTPDSDVVASIHNEMRAYTMRQAPFVASAPGAQVLDVMRTEAAVIDHLQQTNVELCAAFAMTGLEGDIRPDAPLKALIDTAAAARLKAGRAGQDDPQDRQDPAQADFLALYASMQAAGVPEADLQRFFGEGLNGATARQQCDVTTAFYHAILAQPPARAEQVAAYVIKTVAEQQPTG
jgi:hypothetical protein